MFSLGFSLLYQSPVPKVFSVMVLIFCFVMVMIRLGPVGPMLGYEGGASLAYQVRGCGGRVLVGTGSV